MNRSEAEKRLLARIAYDSSSESHLRWVTSTRAGWSGRSIALRSNSDGYALVHSERMSFSAHRLIWQLCCGPIPSGMEIDHINGIRTDNRIENMRLLSTADNQQNRSAQKNSKSGIKGLFRRPNSDFWDAQFTRNKRVFKKCGRDPQVLIQWLETMRSQHAPGLCHR